MEFLCRTGCTSLTVAPFHCVTAQRYSKQALGFVINWHSLRTTYASRSVELGQSPAVVMINTGDSPAMVLDLVE